MGTWKSPLNRLFWPEMAYITFIQIKMYQNRSTNSQNGKGLKIAKKAWKLLKMLTARKIFMTKDCKRGKILVKVLYFLVQWAMYLPMFFVNPASLLFLCDQILNTTDFCKLLITSSSLIGYPTFGKAATSFVRSWQNQSVAHIKRKLKIRKFR